MKMGLMSLPRTPEESILFAKENGFNHVEVDLFKHPLERFSTERIKKIVKLSEENQVSLSVHTPYSMNPAERFSTIREAYKLYFLKAIEFTSAINGKWLTIHLGYHIGFPRDKFKAFKRTKQFIEEMLVHCDKKKVPLAIENVNPMPMNGELFYIGDSIAELKELFESWNSEYAKFCLDIGHAHTAEGVVQYVNAFKDKLVGIHVHDNHGEQDEHLGVGEGNIDWKTVLHSLKKVKNDVPLNLEIYDDKLKIKSKNIIEKILEETE